MQDSNAVIIIIETNMRSIERLSLI